MKSRYRLKKWVVISIYLIAFGAIATSLYLVGKTLKSMNFSTETLSYVYRGIIDDSIPVVNEIKDNIYKPYEKENVEIIINYYDKDQSPEEQEKSLIKYQNIYMPNTGILYGSDESFDVVATLDGTIESITPDEIMGNIITIRHKNNLTTIYQSLNTVDVLVGDYVKKGDIIGTSGSNKVDSSKEYMLLFEVDYNGTTLNPNKYYEMAIEEFE